MIWDRQVMRKVGLRKEEATDRAAWKRGVRAVAAGEVHPATLVNRERNGFKLDRVMMMMMMMMMMNQLSLNRVQKIRNY